MNYYLRVQVLNPAPELPISQDEFDRIRASRALLTAAFAIEESYDLLTSNYIELEQELLTIAVATVARESHEYGDFFDTRATVNRRVVNLLTASRLYHDQIPQRLGACSKTPEVAKAELKRLISEHYDASIAYRFLEAHRNHVQHCGLAVHNLRIASSWTGHTDADVLETSAQPIVERRFLEEDCQFKRKVLAETPEQVDLIKCVREYLQRLGEVHRHLRMVVEPEAHVARAVLQNYISKYSAAHNGQTLGLAAVCRDPNRQNATVPILLNWDDVRLRLIKRNTTLINLTRRVVTGRPAS